MVLKKRPSKIAICYLCGRPLGDEKTDKDHVPPDRQCETSTTIVYPRSGCTQTREVGDLLWPAREGAAELAAQKAALGSYGYAGQYQQRPSPRGGGLFET